MHIVQCVLRSRCGYMAAHITYLLTYCLLHFVTSECLVFNFVCLCVHVCVWYQ